MTKPQWTTTKRSHSFKEKDVHIAPLPAHSGQLDEIKQASGFAFSDCHHRLHRSAFPSRAPIGISSKMNRFPHMTVKFFTKKQCSLCVPAKANIVSASKKVNSPLPSPSPSSLAYSSLAL